MSTGVEEGQEKHGLKSIARCRTKEPLLLRGAEGFVYRPAHKGKETGYQKERGVERVLVR